MLLYDIFGYFAIVLSALSFYEQGSRSKMILYGGASALLLGISLYGYGGITGAFVSIVSLFGKAFSLFGKQYLDRIAQYLIACASILFALFVSSEGAWGMLPAIGMFIVVLADTRKTLMAMKQVYVFSAVVWLLYAIHLESISAIMYDVIGLIVLGYSILSIRYSKAQKGKYW